MCVLVLICLRSASGKKISGLSRGQNSERYVESKKKKMNQTVKRPGVLLPARDASQEKPLARFTALLEEGLHADILRHCTAHSEMRVLHRRSHERQWLSLQPLEQEKTMMTQIQSEAAPRHIATAPSVVHRLLLTCGVVEPVLFNGAYLVEGATRPVYDAWRQAASALSLGDGGWMQIANFIVFGLLTCTGLSICSLPS